MPSAYPFRAAILRTRSRMKMCLILGCLRSVACRWQRHTESHPRYTNQRESQHKTDLHRCQSGRSKGLSRWIKLRIIAMGVIAGGSRQVDVAHEQLLLAIGDIGDEVAVGSEESGRRF